MKIIYSTYDLTDLKKSHINNNLFSIIENKIYHLYLNCNILKSFSEFSFEFLGPILIIEPSDYINVIDDKVSFYFYNRNIICRPEWCDKVIVNNHLFFNICIIISPGNIIDIYINSKYLQNDIFSYFNNF